MKMLGWALLHPRRKAHGEDRARVNSEKGVSSAKSTSFGLDSVFGVIEAHVLSNGAVVICDDLADEWADHIILRSGPVPEIEFVQSKWKEGATTFSERLS
jgi:hypothetical protein